MQSKTCLSKLDKPLFIAFKKTQIIFLINVLVSEKFRKDVYRSSKVHMCSPN